MFRYLILSVVCLGAMFAAPIRTNPAFDQIVFFEGSGGVTPFSFALNSAAMTNQLSTLFEGADFTGVPGEYYDVFYSNSDGTFNLDGEFVTILGVYSGSSSGLNIMDVQLKLAGNFVQRATSVASYVPGASGFILASLANILDSDTNTGTAMGVNALNQVMRVTVGFGVQDEPNNQVPEPATWAMGAVGLGLAALRARQQRNRRTA